MESFRELFELYRKGLLAEDKINELNRSLIEIYFNTPEDLNQEESEYTEDLIFELFANNSLDERYVQVLQEKLDKDKSLSKKYSLSKDLTGAANLIRNRGLQRLTGTDSTDEKEEARLKEILQEVIERVHSEKETSLAKDVMEDFLASVKDFFRGLVEPVQLNQPRVRWALVVASLLIIAGFAWLFLKPGSTDLLVQNPVKQPGKGKLEVVTEKLPAQKEGNSLKEMIKRRMADLVASTFEHATRFDYSLSRGHETTSAEDSFILAAENYNNKNFVGCSKILNDLLKSKSFTDSDTISEINFYLGNCYLIRGINNNNDELLKLSLLSFARIGHKNPYWVQSKWYTVFALAKLGQPEKSLALCDTLLKVHPLPNYGDVKRMRDSIQKIIDIRPEK